jgi:integrase
MTDAELIEKFNAIESKLDTLLLSRLSAAAVTPESPYTLYAWLDEWYAVYKVPGLKPNTLGTIEVAIRVHIKPHLPDVRLHLITGLELQKFLTTTIKQSRTRKLLYDVLNGAFRDARNLKLIPDNPMQGVKIPVHVRKRGKPLTADEERDFLRAIAGHKLEHYFKLLLYTGCRRNEGLTLRLSDVDFKSKLLHVPGTKTETSERTIPLFENVAALLAQIKPQKPFEKGIPHRHTEIRQRTRAQAARPAAYVCYPVLSRKNTAENRSNMAWPQRN